MDHSTRDLSWTLSAVLATMLAANPSLKAEAAPPTRSETNTTPSTIEQFKPLKSESSKSAGKSHRVPKPVPRAADPPVSTPALQPAASQLAQQRSPIAAPAQPDFAQQLRTGGVASCLPRVQALGQGVGNGVATVGTASNWSAKTPDQRIANVLIGQHYDNAKVPYGLTGIFAAPAPNGHCDGYSLQMIPSPSSCADLQRSLLTHGKPLADLAGLPLLQDSTGSQITLVPTAGNGCVVVELRATYSE